MATEEEELQSALGGLLQLVGMTASGPVTAGQVNEAVEKVKALLVQLKKSSNLSAGSASSSSNGPVAHKNVLIAGQLGIVIHQLRQAISKLGGEVTIAKDVEEAISRYQKQDYSLVIIDLFMPSEREGLIVMEEIKRISVVCHIDTQIMVLGPPSKDNNMRELCKSKGASVFLEKAEKWHETILKYYQGEITAEQIELSKL